MGGSRASYEAAQGLIPPAIILGLGFTGQRVAKRLLARGVKVFAFVRNPERFRALASVGLHLLDFEENAPSCALIFHSIPPLPEPENGQIRRIIETLQPRRVVYVSSTGIYGKQTEVDEKTTPRPDDNRGKQRLEEEEWITDGRWSSLILRAAAIYGPGRGVHVAIREGRLPRGASSGVVSRIHADDLAQIAEIGILSDLEGAWPAADNHPCPSAEIAQAFFPENQVKALPAIRVSGRQVDGSAIRAKLGIELIYPTWHSGVLASLAEEKCVMALTREPAGKR